MVFILFCLMSLYHLYMVMADIFNTLFNRFFGILWFYASYILVSSFLLESSKVGWAEDIPAAPVEMFRMPLVFPAAALVLTTAVA